MRKLYISLLFPLLLHCTLFSQNKIIITGKITSNSKPLPNAAIEIFQAQKTVMAISNEKGIYQISLFNINKLDSIDIKVTSVSHKTISQKITILNQTNTIDFILLQDTTLLKEIIIKNTDVISKASRTIYSINSKNFIPTAKADAVLQSIPGLTLRNEESIIINNHLTAKIFIDGIEADPLELKKINANDISKVEVISNPSATYGVDFTGGIINIITKKKVERFIKSDIEAYIKARLNLWGAAPSISYKSKRIVAKVIYNYRANNQVVNNSTEREETGGIFFNQNSNRNIKGYQDFSTARLKLDLNKKIILNFGGSFFRYQFLGSTSGKNISNSLNSAYKIDSKEKYGNAYIYSVYQYKINKNKNFFAKAKYAKFYTEGSSAYQDLVTGNIAYNEVVSTNDETSGELIFENNSTKLLKKTVNYSVGYKYIVRNFNFQASNFNLSQNVSDINFDSEIELSDNLSLAIGLTTDFTNNKTPYFTQKYFYLLPTVSLQYQFKNKTNLKFEYAKKILRPGADELNSQIYFINPILSSKGNENLSPQLRNYFAVSLSKTSKKNRNIFFNIFNTSIKNAIIRTYIQQGNILLLTYNNAATHNVFGSNIGINLKLFKILMVNASTGINYSNFTANTTNTLVKNNEGIAFSNNLFLNSIIHKKLSLTLNAFYDSKNYSLVATTSFNPSVSFSAERPFFKDKLNIRITYNDIFGLYTKSTELIEVENFKQLNITRNKVTNFSIKLIYTFGKVFNDRFSSNAISNDDIQTKQ